MFLGLARFLRTCKSFCIKIFDRKRFGGTCKPFGKKPFEEKIVKVRYKSFCA
jgi:hypothetical protein